MNREQLNRLRRMAGVSQDFSPQQLKEFHAAATSRNGASHPHPRVNDDELDFKGNYDPDGDDQEDDQDDDTIDFKVPADDQHDDMDDADDGAPEFKKGDEVEYNGEQYVVVIDGHEAGAVGIAPKGREHDVGSVEIVAPEELSGGGEDTDMDHPDDMEGDDTDMDHPDDMEDSDDVDIDIDMDHPDKDSDPKIREGAHYHSDGNYETHVDNAKQPTNVTAPYDTVFDTPEFEQEEEDYEMAYDNEKVHVPARVLRDLKSVISSCEKEAKKAERRNHDERKHYYADTAEALQVVHDLLSEKSIEGLKRAQIAAHQMANVSRHLMPDHVWKFIVDGGNKRSLKDYMNDVGKMKYPITGPRNTLDSND